MTLLACNKSNPLLEQPNTPYGVPAFDQIKLEHYIPAFEAAIAEQKAEVETIANNEAEPTFQNTIEALDRTGLLLDRVVGVFFNVLEADGNDEMNAIAEQVSPMLSELSDGIILNDKLFQRVKFVYDQREFQRVKFVYDQREQLGLNPEQMRLVTETYKHFADNGANLPEDKKERLKEINQELALLSLKFGNNVVAETNSDAGRSAGERQGCSRRRSSRSRSSGRMALHAQAHLFHTGTAVLREPRTAQTAAHGLHHTR